MDICSKIRKNIMEMVACYGGNNENCHHSCEFYDIRDGRYDQYAYCKLFGSMLTPEDDSEYYIRLPDCIDFFSELADD